MLFRQARNSELAPMSENTVTCSWLTPSMLLNQGGSKSFERIERLSSVECNHSMPQSMLLNQGGSKSFERIERLSSTECVQGLHFTHCILLNGSKSRAVIIYVYSMIQWTHYMLLNRSIRSKDLLPPWLSSTEGNNQEQHRGWHRVVTLYATQLLNSLKCFPEPLCIHRVVGLSSIYGVVGPHAMHGAWHGVCRLSIIRTTS